MLVEADEGEEKEDCFEDEEEEVEEQKEEEEKVWAPHSRKKAFRMKPEQNYFPLLRVEKSR